MEASSTLLVFLHSLLRYLVLLSVVVAALVSWRGVLMKLPIMVWERMITILAMVLCHVQLLVGLILYGLLYKTMTHMAPEHQRFWKYEHATTMILAIAVITVGRVLSKRAQFEGTKQLLIAVFYTVGLLLILWGTPWPFTAVGRDLGWM